VIDAPFSSNPNGIYMDYQNGDQFHSKWPPRLPRSSYLDKGGFLFICIVAHDSQLLGYEINMTNGQQMYDVDIENVSMWDEAFFWKGLLKEARGKRSRRKREKHRE